MTETQQLIVPEPPPPGPPADRRRAVLTVLTLATVVGVAAVLLSVVRGGDTTTSVLPANGSSTQRRNTTDPIAPQGSATLDPNAQSATEAAVRYNWPLVKQDEFDGTSLDTGIWSPYSGQTTGGVGKHSPDNITVGDGLMTITSHGLESGGMAWHEGQKYGRWEVRAKTQVGTGYGDVLILWPDAEDFPVGGEIDFMEIPKPARKESNFVLHYGEDNSQKGTHVPGDFTEWHNYAVEWMPDHVAGFIDGQEIFRSTDHRQIPPRSMHLAIQQDIGPYGDDWIPKIDSTTPATCKFQIDWVRIYSA